jgi:hypothetical protein
MAASSGAVATTRIARVVTPPVGGWRQGSTMKPDQPSRFAGRIRMSRAGCAIRGSRASPGEPSRCTKERLGNAHPAIVSNANRHVVLSESEHFFLIAMTDLRGFYGIVEILHIECPTDSKKSII